MDITDEMMDMVAQAMADHIDNTIRKMLYRNGIETESNDVEEIKKELDKYGARLWGLKSGHFWEQHVNIILTKNEKEVDRVSFQSKPMLREFSLEKLV